MGLLFVADALYMLFFSTNMDSFAENIRLGQIDFLLVKPINSQFMVSLKKADTSKLGNLLMALTWMIWSLAKLEDWNANRLFWLLILVPSGLVSLYAFRFFFVTLAIFFSNSTNLQYIWYQFYHLGMKPDSIYRPWIRVALFVVAPVSLMANVPARALMDPFSPGLYLAAVLVAAFFLYLSHRFWNFALKYHSSASS